MCSESMDSFIKKFKTEIILLKKMKIGIDEKLINYHIFTSLRN
jgi:hypothetical protein